MELQFGVSYTTPSGPGAERIIGATGDEFSRGATAVLGAAVNNAINDAAPRGIDLARALVDRLRSRRSLWPSAGTSQNRGPYSTMSHSQMSFMARQGRDERGRFGRNGVLINDARNRRGIPYAAFVNAGIRTGGNPVGPDAMRRNVDAVQRTWADGFRTGNLPRVARRYRDAAR